MPQQPRLCADWGFEKLQAPEALGLSTGDGTVIAIIDDGVDLTHRDLDDALWTNPADGSHGWNFVNGNNDPSIGASHGTQMAFVAVAETDNRRNNASMGWNARITVLKVGGASGSSPDLLDDAIDYAVDHGADAINVSLFRGNGWDCADMPEVQAAIDRAFNAGILVFAAGSGAGVPLNCEHVIGVSASDPNDVVQNSGAGSPLIDVSVPSSSRRSVAPTVSHATAQVSGLAALVRAYNPDYGADEVAQAILCNADPIGQPEGLTGEGRINAYRAVLNGATGCNPDY